MINVQVEWRNIKYSPYMRGAIKSSSVGIEKIFMHKNNGQIRVYSPEDLDGRDISVNGDTAVNLQAKGWFGKLYIGERK